MTEMQRLGLILTTLMRVYGIKDFALLVRDPVTGQVIGTQEGSVNPDDKKPPLLEVAH